MVLISIPQVVRVQGATSWCLSAINSKASRNGDQVFFLVKSLAFGASLSMSKVPISIPFLEVSKDSTDGD